MWGGGNDDDGAVAGGSSGNGECLGDVEDRKPKATGTRPWVFERGVNQRQRVLWAMDLREETTRMAARCRCCYLRADSRVMRLVNPLGRDNEVVGRRSLLLADGDQATKESHLYLHVVLNFERLEGHTPLFDGDAGAFLEYDVAVLLAVEADRAFDDEVVGRRKGPRGAPPPDIESLNVDGRGRACFDSAIDVGARRAALGIAEVDVAAQSDDVAADFGPSFCGNVAFGPHIIFDVTVPPERNGAAHHAAARFELVLRDDVPETSEVEGPVVADADLDAVADRAISGKVDTASQETVPDREPPVSKYGPNGTVVSPDDISVNSHESDG
mmetsp:Transcript_22296/g.68619  ORF Transcript_22296/g.68619 Transcript_22296/m.68619 type:complete len:328 (-) Transcript_22296:394-1377(-)